MAATANDLTRQQLDELDTLLQRMLNVPASKPEPAASPLPEAPAGWRADPAAVQAAPHLNGNALQLLAELQPLSRIPLPSEIAPPLALALFAPAKPELVGVLELPEEFDPVNLAELKAVPAEAVLVPAVPVSRVEKLTPLAMPLFAVNWLLEGSLKLFGPPGVAMTRRPGKNLLAFAGILMMLGAGLWTAQGFGLVKLPMK